MIPPYFSFGVKVSMSPLEAYLLGFAEPPVRLTTHLTNWFFSAPIFRRDFSSPYDGLTFSVSRDVLFLVVFVV